MRRIFEYVAVHRDTCSLTYGQGACTASLSHAEEKCFNTISTCQDPDHFTKTTTVDYFTSHENVSLPPNVMFNTHTAYPFLSAVAHTPAELNPSGASVGSDSLGKRAQITITLIDAASDDQYQDPYFFERINGAARADNVGYNPDERGTFFGKYFARNQYLWGRQIDWVTGEIDDSGMLTNSLMRSYVIKSVSGPDSQGKVQIIAQDVLMLTNSSTAKCPIPSDGKLSADIDDSETSFTVAPPGVGGSYPSSGTIQVGEEQMTFTRADDAFTVTRAQNGSEPQDHKHNDTVQLCAVFDNLMPNEVVFKTLSEYTDIPQAMLNTVQWAQEVQARPWLQHRYSAIIGKPTGVKDLLNDIAQQQLFFPFVDESDNDIKIKAIAPTFAPQDVPIELNDREHIIADSFSRSIDDDAAITRVYSHIGVRNWAKDLKSADNYRTVLVNITPREESKERRGRPNSRDVFGYWLTDALADNLASVTMQQFAKAPEVYSFSLDAKDKRIKVSDFVLIEDRGIVDPFGLPLKRSAQVISAAESIKASLFKYKAIAYSQINVGSKAGDYRIPIPASRYNYVTRTEFISFFPNVILEDGDVVSFYPTSNNVVIGSVDTTMPAFLSNTLPIKPGADASTITVNLFGSGHPDESQVFGFKIVGRGGDGGGTKLIKGVNTALPGLPGGDALASEIKTALFGTFVVGGGGGGGGGLLWASYTGSIAFGGGGGAGFVNSNGGIAARVGGSPMQDGKPGTIDAGGAAGGLEATGSFLTRSGGYLGQYGGSVNDPYGGVSGAAGGAPGRAIVGYSNVDDSGFTGTYFGVRS